MKNNRIQSLGAKKGEKGLTSSSPFWGLERPSFSIPGPQENGRTDSIFSEIGIGCALFLSYLFEICKFSMKKFYSKGELNVTEYNIQSHSGRFGVMV